MAYGAIIREVPQPILSSLRRYDRVNFGAKFSVNASGQTPQEFNGSVTLRF